MKQKIITTIVTLIAVLTPLLVAPVILYDKSNTLRLWVLLIGGAFLLIMLLLNLKTFKPDSKDILILIFLGFAIISTCLSSNIEISIWGHQGRFEGLLMFIIYICIYFCSKKYFKHENYKEILNILFYTCMIIGVLGIAQKYISFKRLYPIFNKGICATFGNSNFFGSFITIVLPIVISIFTLKGSKKCFVLSLIMFFNMISSGTRSAWVAFFVGSIFFLVFLIKNKNKTYFKRILVLLLSFIIIFMYLLNGFSFIKNKIYPQKQEIKEINNSKTEESIKRTQKEIKQSVKNGNLDRMGSGRIEIWKMTMKVILNRPIFGCGVDNLNNGLHTYCEEEINNRVSRTGKDIDKAHNEYLQIAATIGIPALIVYLSFLSLILFPKMKEMFKNKLLFILVLTIICYLTQAFFNISTIGVAPLFWMLLGIIDNKEMIGILKID
ncbi:MAG: O-antigen ligase family protein [Clostridia bacterium]|nr:O-antigen ligase family protein [Clostridia bacterium]